MINASFGVMVAVVGVLAGASSARFYLVMTLGERIVADFRRDVFAHLLALSPAFFDTARSGELVSRLTADTTQIKSAVGASVSIALRNLVLFVGAVAMMVVTSPRLSGFVLLAIPVIVIPIVAFGRCVRQRSRYAQDTLADATAFAAELSARSGLFRPIPGSGGQRAVRRRGRGGLSRRAVPRGRGRCSPRSSSSSCSPAWSRSVGAPSRAERLDQHRRARSVRSTRSSPPARSAS